MKYLRRFYARYINSLLFESDTVTIRTILATASLFFGASVMSSSIPFTKDAYSIMAVIGNEWFWGGVFIAHFISTMWLLQAPGSNPKASIVINSYGAFIWFYYTVSVVVAVGYWPPSIAMESVVGLLAFWSLIRTPHAS
jgi:hypothetical protein